MRTPSRWLVLLIILLSYSSATAQQDSLVIHFKNGGKQVVALKDIRKLSFDTLKSDVKQSPSNSSMIAYPNPTMRSVRLVFELRQAGPVEVRIIENSGKVLRVIQERYSELGSREIVWDGLDALGQKVPAGNYVCEIKCREQLLTSKVIVLNE